MPEELNLSQAPTPSEYHAWVDEQGRAPTQAPVYNHSAGSPSRRTSTAQELLSRGVNPLPEGQASSTTQEATADEEQPQGQ